MSSVHSTDQLASADSCTRRQPVWQPESRVQMADIELPCCGLRPHRVICTVQNSLGCQGSVTVVHPFVLVCGGSSVLLRWLPVLLVDVASASGRLGDRAASVTIMDCPSLTPKIPLTPLYTYQRLIDSLTRFPCFLLTIYGLHGPLTHHDS